MCFYEGPAVAFKSRGPSTKQWVSVEVLSLRVWASGCRSANRLVIDSLRREQIKQDIK